MSCPHETIQLSQDGERVIVCGDCGREFGQIAHDEAETLVVFAPDPTTVIVVDGAADAARGVALRNAGGILRSEPTFPCARCGFTMTCPTVEGEDCHT